MKPINIPLDATTILGILLVVLCVLLVMGANTNSVVFYQSHYCNGSIIKSDADLVSMNDTCTGAWLEYDIEYRPTGHLT
jgi:hypothetical protein